jgi:ABC-2 type transport system ATP-binding protein
MNDCDDAAVVTQELGKSYGGRQAVSGLNLTVPAGTTFGFLGPNGAGKTTTIGMLCTLLRPTKGRAEVAGCDVVTRPDEVRSRIGLLFQESTLDPDLSASENLRFYAELFGLPRRQVRPAVAGLLELVDLADRAESMVRTFSGGMRRRLEIARGLVHAPQVLFLDEPTSGLDPQTRTAIWEHLHRLRREQAITLFMTTHHLAEAERCDRIAIIDRGELVAEGTPTELKRIVGADLVVLCTDDDEAAARTVDERFGLAARPGPDGVQVRVPDGAAFVPRLCAALDTRVASVTVLPPTLDDVFLHFTGRTIRESNAGMRMPADLGAR